jgi:gliding motility-associated lipoprotein GldH
MSNMKQLLFLVIVLSCLFSACGPNYFYQSSKDIPDGIWRYKDTLDFPFTIEDTAALYRIYVDFSHSDTFPNQNLYMKISTLFPDGKRVSKPYSFDFFNAQGASNGSCSGRRCSLQAVLQENAVFRQPGKYVLTFEQFMRKDAVPGIRSVGLTLEKTKQKH